MCMYAYLGGGSCFHQNSGPPGGFSLSGGNFLEQKKVKADIKRPWESWGSNTVQQVTWVSHWATLALLCYYSILEGCSHIHTHTCIYICIYAYIYKSKWYKQIHTHTYTYVSATVGDFDTYISIIQTHTDTRYDTNTSRYCSLHLLVYACMCLYLLVFVCIWWGIVLQNNDI